MKKQIYYCKNLRNFLAVILLLFSVQIFTQTLPNFTLTVTPTNETCAGNGALAFTTSGTDPLATVTNYVYKFPNFSTAVAAVAGTTGNVTGLTAGSYRIVSVQSRTGFPNNQQVWNGSIVNNVPAALTYTTANTNEICGSDGTITVTKTGSGILNPTTPYELWNATGTVVVRPAQSSNIFTGLAAGSYLVKVKDSCGQYVTQSVNVTKLTPNVNFTNTGSISETSAEVCSAKISFDINSGSTTSVVNFPIDIEITVYDPSGTVNKVITRTVDNPDFVSSTAYLRYVFDIPFFGTQDYHYEIKITDDCDLTYTRDIQITANPAIIVRPRVGCTGTYFGIESVLFSSPITYTVTGTGTASSYGTQTFTNVTNQTVAGTIDLFLGSASSPMPNGPYIITATDNCGNSVTSNYTNTYTLPTIGGSNYTSVGCADGSINIGIYAPNGVTFASATLVSAPASYSGPTTATIDSANEQETFNIETGEVYNGNVNSWLEMNSVPAGTYTFEIVDNCGRIYNVSRTLNQGKTNGNVVINQVLACGAFNLDLNITGSNTYNDRYVLERWDSANSTWQQIGGNLVNNSSNGAYTLPGQYRVVKKFQVQGASFITGNYWYNGYDCTEVLKTFTYSSNMLQIDVVNSFACSDGIHYNLFASASNGVAPYTFQLVAKSGDPSFVATNPTSSTANTGFWTNLTEGAYKIRVTDSCLNTKEIWVDLKSLPAPGITPSQICNGQNGSLSVQNNPYLNFSWTKDADPTVLSTSSVLNFTPFNAATMSGTYYVHITSSVAGSCVDQVLSFTIDDNISNPNAGADETNSFCNTVVSLDLDTLLDAGVDNYGTWTEITNPVSGYLANGVWSPSQAGAGTYYFQYTVNGLCSGQDTSVFTVTVTECGACYRDPVTSSPGTDSKHGITLLKRAGAENGNWPMVRKSAHTVLESNTKGFVVTRIAAADLANISDPVEGMMVYDTTEKCLKLYDGTSWNCFVEASCP